MQKPVLIALDRAFHFARHMPPRKLARRLELDIKRRLRDRLGAAPMPAPVPAVTAQPPLPVMPPRLGLMRQEHDKLVFHFIGRQVAVPATAIDWQAGGSGASNQLWNMNLHYMEYLEGTDQAQFEQLVTAWISANGTPRRGAWRDSWNSYAISLRTVVWMQQLARRAGDLPEATVRLVQANLAGQMRFLEQNLETDLGGNHLIKNIKALIWASAYFTCSDAARWRQRGLALLDEELDRQILPDGMHDERSCSYHAQVFADLLEARHVLGAGALAGKLDGALVRMAQVLADLTHPDGGAALFNDSGLNMAYSPGQCLAAYAAAGARSPEPRRVFAFPQAGYFGARAGGMYTIADCGRIAPDDLPAHGHADVLSFEWSVQCRRIIVDQGVFQYAAGERRQRARSALSHNTLCIEGGDQADFFGAFRCGRRPDVTLRTWEPRADGFILEGSHDGFTRLPGAPVHIRRIEAVPGRLHIGDRVDTSEPVACSVSFLLHPEVHAEVMGTTARLVSGPVTITAASSHPFALEEAVWWPDMGHEIRTKRLSARLPAADRAFEVTFQIK